jgi:glycosyltransferase involved in cell wall biosynthesis
MKLLFVVDGRSPIALNWIKYFVDQGYEVHLASMYPCQPDLELASLSIISVAFSDAVEAGVQRSGNPSLKRRILQAVATPNVRTWLRQHFVPRSLPKAAATLQSLITDLQPDLIHAMRIPYEGMLAALALSQVEGLANSALSTAHPPLLVSIWGNDFTLHAPATRQMSRLTHFTMEHADALHTDCYRDQPLAQAWGFDPAKPAVVLPGAGGIQLDVFYPFAENLTKVFEPSQGYTVINPRGLRVYVRNDTFFKAIPLVLQQLPDVRFLCTTMAGAPEAERWVRELNIAHAVDLLPRQSRPQMADLFRQAQVVVSPSTHDGTPNTLLEAMACGCFPVVGDIESLREWITPGKNGFLVDPADPQGLAEAILIGLQNPELRAQAHKQNARLIAERAEYHEVMRQAAEFYRLLILDN